MSPWWSPGLDAYSALVVIKIGGRRIVGGLCALEKTNDGFFAPFKVDMSAFANELRAPFMPEESAADPIETLTVSVCLVRKNDGRCLHLLTDVSVSDVDEDRLLFNELGVFDIFATPPGSSRFGQYQHEDEVWGMSLRGYHDFGLYSAEFDDDSDRLRGFREPFGELRLYGESDFFGSKPALKCWHASKNWV